MSKTITLRQATIQDADMLLNWRNDPETRSASHSTTIVIRDEHISWLNKSLNNVNRKLLVAEENGSPVGTVRADLSGGGWQLSWIVAPNARGKGIAKRMVALLAKSIFEPIRAEVKSENLASARVAEHAGMAFIRKVEGTLHYCRKALK